MVRWVLLQIAKILVPLINEKTILNPGSGFGVEFVR